jgi:hypothetical protein
MSSHGQRANKSGQILEGLVRGTLVGPQAFGFEILSNAQYEKARATNAPLPARFLVKGPPFDTLYGTKGKTEYRIHCRDISPTKAFPVEGDFVCRVECKYQATAGSVDEKFPYLYLSCVEAMPERNIIILMEAKGARAQAVKWLANAVLQQKYDPTKSKRIVLMTIAEFMEWSHNAFGAYTRSDSSKSRVPDTGSTLELSSGPTEVVGPV